MTDAGRAVLQAISIMFLTLLFIGCVIRVFNKKGTWTDVVLAMISVPSWIFAVCA